MLRGDHGDFVAAQPHEVADRKQSHQVDEAFEQRLVEGRVALLAHDAADPRGCQPLPVRTVAAQRVEDVGDRHDHRAQVQLAAADLLRIPAQILPQVVLEGDNRRQRRHLRRPPQDVRAVDDVPFHDREFFVRQLVRFVEHVERRVHFADVVHQRGEAELAQQRSVDVQRARLRHRQRRHVHHVRERVVVVLLQRRQRHQRRPVLRDDVRQAVDDLSRILRVRFLAGLRLLPQ